MEKKNVFSVKSVEFTDAVKLAANVAPVKTAYPVLTSIKISVYENSVKIYAANMEDSICLDVVKASGEYEGEFCVNCQSVLKSLEKAKSDYGEIEFEISESQAEMMQESGLISNFALVDYAEFPAFPEGIPNGNFGILSVEKIKHVSSNLTPFVAKPETGRSKGALEGVLMEFTKNGLTFVSTDASKLNILEYTDAKIASEKEHIVILRPKFLQTAAKLCSTYFANEESLISYVVGQENICLRGKNFTYYSGIIEGPYPNYRKVLPESVSAKVVFDKQKLIDGIKRVLPTTSGTSNNLIKFRFDDGKAELTTENAEKNEKTSISISANCETKGYYGFNGKLLLETLKFVASEEVIFGLNKNSQGVMIYGNSESKFKKETKLIMPLRIAETLAEETPGCCKETEITEVKQIESEAA